MAPFTEPDDFSDLDAAADAYLGTSPEPAPRRTAGIPDDIPATPPPAAPADADPYAAASEALDQFEQESIKPTDLVPFGRAPDNSPIMKTRQEAISELYQRYEIAKRTNPDGAASIMAEIDRLNPGGAIMAPSSRMEKNVNRASRMVEDAPAGMTRAVKSAAAAIGITAATQPARATLDVTKDKPGSLMTEAKLGIQTVQAQREFAAPESGRGAPSQAEWVKRIGKMKEQDAVFEAMSADPSKRGMLRNIVGGTVQSLGPMLDIGASGGQNPIGNWKGWAEQGAGDVLQRVFKDEVRDEQGNVQFVTYRDPTKYSQEELDDMYLAAHAVGAVYSTVEIATSFTGKRGTYGAGTGKKLADRLGKAKLIELIAKNPKARKALAKLGGFLTTLAVENTEEGVQGPTIVAGEAISSRMLNDPSKEADWQQAWKETTAAFQPEAMGSVLGIVLFGHGMQKVSDFTSSGGMRKYKSNVKEFMEANGATKEQTAVIDNEDAPDGIKAKFAQWRVDNIISQAPYTPVELAKQYAEAEVTGNAELRAQLGAQIMELHSVDDAAGGEVPGSRKTGKDGKTDFKMRFSQPPADTAFYANAYKQARAEGLDHAAAMDRLDKQYGLTSAPKDGNVRDDLARYRAIGMEDDQLAKVRELKVMVAAGQITNEEAAIKLATLRDEFEARQDKKREEAQNAVGKPSAEGLGTPPGGVESPGAVPSGPTGRGIEGNEADAAGDAGDGQGPQGTARTDPQDGGPSVEPSVSRTYDEALTEMGVTAEQYRELSTNVPLTKQPAEEKARFTVGPSPIDGQGTFMRQEVKAGQDVGTAWMDGKKTGILGRYINHGTTPNVRIERRGSTATVVALRDLKVGEELTIDYVPAAAVLSDLARSTQKSDAGKAQPQRQQGIQAEAVQPAAPAAQAQESTPIASTAEESEARTDSRLSEAESREELTTDDVLAAARARKKYIGRKLPDGSGHPLSVRARKLLYRAESEGFQVIDDEGSRFDSGMALQVVAFEARDGLSDEVIGETLTPTIRKGGKILKMGQVVVYTPKASAESVAAAAHQAATSPKNDIPEPTQAQKRVGRPVQPEAMTRGRPVSLDQPEAQEQLEGEDARYKNAINDDGTVTIHRAVIKGTNIAPGDFVTLRKEEADGYADRPNMEVLSLRVPQKDVVYMFDAKGPHPIRYAPGGQISENVPRFTLTDSVQPKGGDSNEGLQDDQSGPSRENGQGGQPQEEVAAPRADKAVSSRPIEPGVADATQPAPPPASVLAQVPAPPAIPVAAEPMPSDTVAYPQEMEDLVLAHVEAIRNGSYKSGGLAARPGSEKGIPGTLKLSADFLRGTQIARINGHKAVALAQGLYRSLLAVMSKKVTVYADMFAGAGTVTMAMHTIKATAGKPVMMSEYSPMRAVMFAQLAGPRWREVAESAIRHFRILDPIARGAAEAVKTATGNPGDPASMVREAADLFSNHIMSLPTPAGATAEERNAVIIRAGKEFWGVYLQADGSLKIDGETGKPIAPPTIQMLQSHAAQKALNAWSRMAVKNYLQPGQDLSDLNKLHVRTERSHQAALEMVRRAWSEKDPTQRNWYVNKAREQYAELAIAAQFKNDPETAGLNIAAQHYIGAQSSTIVEFDRDGNLKGLFGLIGIAKVPTEDDIRKDAETIHKALDGATVLQADSWVAMPEIARMVPGVGFVVDPSYFAEEGKGVRNYESMTNIENNAQLLALIDLHLLPAWDAGARMVITNTWHAETVAALRERGFQIHKFDRKGEAKEEDRSYEFIAINFDPSNDSGEIFPRRVAPGRAVLPRSAEQGRTPEQLWDRPDRTGSTPRNLKTDVELAPGTSQEAQVRGDVEPRLMPSDQGITAELITDVADRLHNPRLPDYRQIDEQRTAQFLADNASKPYMADYIKAMNDTLDEATRLMGDTPFDRRNLAERIITRDPQAVYDNPDGIWPIPVYVAADGDPNTIGLLLHRDGKKEMFEGNDEATPATYELVDQLLNVGDEQVKVWTSQPSDVVQKIKAGEIPAGIYVSPNRSHAEGYWGEGRELVSFKIPLKRVAKESDVDWKVREAKPDQRGDVRMMPADGASLGQGLRALKRFYAAHQRGQMPKIEDSTSAAMMLLDYYEDYGRWYRDVWDKRKHDKQTTAENNRVRAVFEIRRQELQAAINSGDPALLNTAVDNGINQWHLDYPVIYHFSMQVDDDALEKIVDDLGKTLDSLGRLPRRSPYRDVRMMPANTRQRPARDGLTIAKAIADKWKKILTDAGAKNVEASAGTRGETYYAQFTTYGGGFSIINLVPGDQETPWKPQGPDAVQKFEARKTDAGWQIFDNDTDKVSTIDWSTYASEAEAKDVVKNYNFYNRPYFKTDAEKSAWADESASIMASRKGKWMLTLGDTELPKSLRGKGVMTRLLRAARTVTGSDLAEKSLGVHMPLDAEGWRSISRNAGMDPRFMPFAGPSSKSANSMKLATAMTMANAGADPKAIWSKTGWWEGPDGKWRFEIPDNGMTWNRERQPWVDAQLGTPLSTLIKHPMLFRAYPWLEKLNVMLVPGPYESGSFGYTESGKPIITISENAALETKRTILLHEIQHAIQAHENYETGGNPDRAATIIARRKFLETEAGRFAKAIDRAMSEPERVHLEKQFDEVMSELKQVPAEKDARNLYLRYAGEVEARTVEARDRMTPARRRSEAPFETMERMMRESGLLKAGQTMADVMIASKSGKMLRSSRDVQMMPAVAYHGSPHTFDRFDMNMIGTGEGSQMFGHGLYFAGKRAVAEWYRNKAGGTLLYDGIQLDNGQAFTNALSKYGPTGPETIAIGRVQNLNDVEKAALQLSRDSAGWGLDHPTGKALNAAYEWLQDNKSRFAWAKGRLYQVTLAPNDDEWLDWDKPFSQQSEKVKNALRDPQAAGQSMLPSFSHIDFTADELAREAGEDTVESIGSGEDIYKAISRLLASSVDASDSLRKMGIPGIRYRDQGSRGDTTNSPTSNYVVFDDSLITVDVRMMPAIQAGDVDGLGFFSNLRRVLNQKMPNRASVAQVRAIIDPAKGSGVKADEIEWTGMRDFLDALTDDQMVTKDEVLAAVRPLELNQVVKGRDPDEEWGRIKADAMRQGYTAEEFGRAYGEYSNTVEEAREELLQSFGKLGDYVKQAWDAHKGPGSAVETKFEGYQLPGGENYREWLLTLPTTSATDRNTRLPTGYRVEQGRDAWVLVGPDGRGRTITSLTRNAERWEATDEARAMLRHTGTLRDNADFTAGHWNEPNVIVHFRTTDRDIPIEDIKTSHPALYARLKAEGRTTVKAIHGDEFQSDWHQKGRDNGYQKKWPEAEIAKFTVEDPKASNLPQFGDDWIVRNGAGNILATPPKYLHATAESALRTVQESARKGYLDGMGSVPNAPFKDTKKGWTALAVKRLLRIAAEGGYDMVTWTTGQQQIDRYNQAMRQNVDRIMVEPLGYRNREWRAERNLTREARRPGVPSWEAQEIAPDGVITSHGFYATHAEAIGYIDLIKSQRAGDMTMSVQAFKNGRTVYGDRVPLNGTTRMHGIENVGLEDVIGKNLAAQVRANPDQKHDFSGDDLSIGRHGMREYYDGIVASVVADQTKKYGAEMGDVAVQADKVLRQYRAQEWYEKGKPGFVVWDADAEKVISYHNSMAEAKTALGVIKSGNKQPLHAVSVPEAMVDGVMSGQPMFMPAKSTFTVNDVAADVDRNFPAGHPVTFLTENPIRADKKEMANTGGDGDYVRSLLEELRTKYEDAAQRSYLRAAYKWMLETWFNIDPDQGNTTTFDKLTMLEDTPAADNSYDALMSVYATAISDMEKMAKNNGVLDEQPPYPMEDLQTFEREHRDLHSGWVPSSIVTDPHAELDGIGSTWQKPFEIGPRMLAYKDAQGWHIAKRRVAMGDDTILPPGLADTQEADFALITGATKAQLSLLEKLNTLLREHNAAEPHQRYTARQSDEEEVPFQPGEKSYAADAQTEKRSDRNAEMAREAGRILRRIESRIARGIRLHHGTPVEIDLQPYQSPTESEARAIDLAKTEGLTLVFLRGSIPAAFYYPSEPGAIFVEIGNCPTQGVIAATAHEIAEAKYDRDQKFIEDAPALLRTRDVDAYRRKYERMARRVISHRQAVKELLCDLYACSLIGTDMRGSYSIAKHFDDFGAAMAEMRVWASIGSTAAPQADTKATGPTAEQRSMPATGPPAVTSDQDAAYMKAVEAGDTATAQRMVDEAAKAAGYKYEAWRADDYTGTVLRKSKTSEGIFFADTKEDAEFYGAPARYHLRAIAPFVSGKDDASKLIEAAQSIAENAEQQFVSKKGPYPQWQWDLLSYLESEIANASSNDMIKDAASKAIAAVAEKYGQERVEQVFKAAGYDSYFDTLEKSKAIFDSSQAKSADPVTRDDQGNVIPLSKRFDSTTPDIRMMPGRDDLSMEALEDDFEKVLNQNPDKGIKQHRWNKHVLADERWPEQVRGILPRLFYHMLPNKELDRQITMFLARCKNGNDAIMRITAKDTDDTIAVRGNAGIALCDFYLDVVSNPAVAAEDRMMAKQNYDILAPWIANAQKEMGQFFQGISLMYKRMAKSPRIALMHLQTELDADNLKRNPRLEEMQAILDNVSAQLKAEQLKVMEAALDDPNFVRVTKASVEEAKKIWHEKNEALDLVQTVCRQYAKSAFSNDDFTTSEAFVASQKKATEMVYDLEKQMLEMVGGPKVSMMPADTDTQQTDKFRTLLAHWIAGQIIIGKGLDAEGERMLHLKAVAKFGEENLRSRWVDARQIAWSLAAASVNESGGKFMEASKSKKKRVKAVQPLPTKVLELFSKDNPSYVANEGKDIIIDLQRGMTGRSEQDTIDDSPVQTAPTKKKPADDDMTGTLFDQQEIAKRKQEARQRLQAADPLSAEMLDDLEPVEAAIDDVPTAIDDTPVQGAATIAPRAADDFSKDPLLNGTYVGGGKGAAEGMLPTSHGPLFDSMTPLYGPFLPKSEATPLVTREMIEFMVPENLNAFLKDFIKNHQVELKKLVLNHYVGDLTIPLRQAMQERFGFTPYRADVVFKALTAAMDKLVAHKKKAMLESAMSESNIKKLSQKDKAALGKMLEMAQLGAFNQEERNHALAAALGLPHITADDAATMVTLSKAVQTAKLGMPRQKALENMAQFLIRKRGVTVGALLYGYAYNAMMSSPRTFNRNIWGYLTATMMDTPLDLAMNPRGASTFLRAFFMTGREGMMDHAAALAGEVVSRAPNKFDFPSEFDQHQFKGIGKAVGAFKYVGRNMVGSDMEFFRPLSNAKTASLLYYVARKSMGMKHGAAQKWAIEQVFGTPEQQRQNAAEAAQDYPGTTTLDKIQRYRRARELAMMRIDGDIVAQAQEFAAQLGMNNDPSGLAGYFYRLASKWPKVARLAVAPFIRIPSNMVTQMTDWMGYGIVRGLFGRSDTWRFTANKDVYETSEQRWKHGMKGAVGLLMSYLLKRWWDDEEEKAKAEGRPRRWDMHGFGPNDAAARKQLMETGWKPYSIQIGDTYYQYLLAPATAWLVIPASFTDAIRYKLTKPTQSTTLYGIQAAARMAMDASYVSTMRDIADGLTDTSGRGLANLERFLTGQVTKFAPNVLTTISKMIDGNTIREPDNILERIISALPIARETMVAEAVNDLGDVVVSNDWALGLVPFISHRKNDDPAWQMVEKHQAWIPPADRNMTILTKNGVERPATGDERREFLTLRGKAIRADMEYAIAVADGTRGGQEPEFAWNDTHNAMSGEVYKKGKELVRARVRAIASLRIALEAVPNEQSDANTDQVQQAVRDIANAHAFFARAKIGSSAE